MKQTRITSAQAFVLHAGLSLLIGALVAGLTALGQSLFTSNDPKVIIGAGLAAFSAWFVHGLVGIAGNPQTLTAGVDTIKTLEDLQGQLNQQSQTIDAHGQAITSLLAQPAPQAAAVPVQQVPFPVQGAVNFAPVTATQAQSFVQPSGFTELETPAVRVGQ